MRMKQKIPIFFNCLNNAFELAEPAPPQEPVKSKFGLDDLGQTSKPKASPKFRKTISAAAGGMDRNTLFKKLNMFINVKKLANHMIKMLEIGAHPKALKKEIGSSNGRQVHQEQNREVEHRNDHQQVGGRRQEHHAVFHRGDHAK